MLLCHDAGSKNAFTVTKGPENIRNGRVINLDEVKRELGLRARCSD